MVPSSTRNWIGINAVQQSSSTKSKNKNNDNSTLKKIHLPSNPALANLICTSADGSSRGRERWQRRQREHSRGRWCPQKPRPQRRKKQGSWLRCALFQHRLRIKLGHSR